MLVAEHRASLDWGADVNSRTDREMVRALLPLLAVILLVTAPAARTQEKRAPAGTAVLGATQPAADYLLARLRLYRIVLVGESHWLRHDAELLGEVIERLEDPETRIAVEWVPAGRQADLDRLTSAPEWSPALALSLLRAGAWPYREYLDALHAVWRVNRQRDRSLPRTRVLALGPPSEGAGAPGQPPGPERFMADIVTRELASPRARVLAWLGLHHAFTRYHLPDLPLRGGGRVNVFSDRAGNVIWRSFGQQVFSIVLHHPWVCWQGTEWGRCLPLDGELDCAAANVGSPVGFDVTTAPIGARLISPAFWYGQGQPAVRLLDLVDGYVWSRPIEEYRQVGVIPLEEFAPDDEALAEVMRRNPIRDEPFASAEQLRAAWQAYTASMKDTLTRRRWTHLVGWRDGCGKGPR